MTTCFNCPETCELSNGYYGFYENGWLALEINHIINGYIGTHKVDICPNCQTISLNKILENNIGGVPWVENVKQL